MYLLYFALIYHNITGRLLHRYQARLPLEALANDPMSARRCHDTFVEIYSVFSLSSLESSEDKYVSEYAPSKH